MPSCILKMVKVEPRDSSYFLVLSKMSILGLIGRSIGTMVWVLNVATKV